MLSFATEFPVGDEHLSDAFLVAVKNWILDSPHTCLVIEDLAEIGGIGQRIAQKGNETVVSLRARPEASESASVRYKRLDEGIEWTTTVTFSRVDAKSWVAIRVFCESTHPAVRLPPVKKPIVVKALLQALGGGRDGDLSVLADPHILTDSDLDLAARMISGDANCRLPVIYVSSNFRGGYVLDVTRLASDMAGVAHILVEPDRAFSLRLKEAANSENVYGGAIGIYWPDRGGRRSFFIGKGFETAGELARAIFDEVRIALTNRRPLIRCTWANTQEMVSRQIFEELRASGSVEVKKYIDAFDEELSSKEEKLGDAEREIGRLKAELRIYEARTPSKGGTTLFAGAEQDLYPAEISGIVLDALRDYETRVPRDSRRSHVLSALIGANLYESESDSIRERLRALLRGFTKLNQRIRRGLEDLGFSISEDGKHCKITFQGDDRYTFTLPKSGSDHRGGMNAANDIGRLLF